jgi:hypothetical protein
MKEAISDIDYFDITSDHRLRGMWRLTLDYFAYNPDVLAEAILVFSNEVLDFTWINHAENASACLRTVAFHQSKSMLHKIAYLKLLMSSLSRRFILLIMGML